MPWESAPPLLTIAAAVAAMGGLQGVVQLAFYGKPKAIGRGQWDYKMEERDERLNASGGGHSMVIPPPRAFLHLVTRCLASVLRYLYPFRLTGSRCR